MKMTAFALGMMLAGLAHAATPDGGRCICARATERHCNIADAATGECTQWGGWDYRYDLVYSDWNGRTLLDSWYERSECAEALQTYPECRGN